VIYRTPPDPLQKPFGAVPVFQQAIAMHRQGRLREAEQLYRDALRGNERHFGALYHVGLLKLQQGQLEEAERWFRRALDVNGSSAETCHQLGMVLAGLQRPEEAVACYEQGLAINPALAESRNNLGHALQTLGRLEDAREQYEKALALKPAYPEASNNLGNLLHLLDRSEEAVVQYERALALHPRYAEAHTNLGNVLAKLGRVDEAIAHLNQALSINPREVEAHDFLALVLSSLGRTEQALAHWDQVIALEPARPGIQINRGRALRVLGRVDESIASFEKATALAPRNPTGYLELARTKRLTEADSCFVEMLKLARNLQALPEGEQIELHFALAKAFDDIGNREEAFWHLLEGNTKKREQLTYDEGVMLLQIERTRAAFSLELMRAKQGLGEPAPVPVFIIGLPRSGTTLVEQILASHPKVFGAGEQSGLGSLVARIPGFPEGISTIASEQLHELGAGYVRAIQPIAPATAERVIDRTPANFLLAGLIPLVLPNARIIHSCRDRRDTALSCFSTLFENGHEHTYDLPELGRYLRAYEILMEHWRGVLPPGTMLDVQYEDLVDDLEGNARRIVAHCGLDWDEACLAFHKTQRPVLSASAVQVRQPLYRTSVGRWRAYEQALQPLLEALEGA
jgi:tetratricopeptide (TPR) repeat protein